MKSTTCEQCDRKFVLIDETICHECFETHQDEKETQLNALRFENTTLSQTIQEMQVEIDQLKERLQNEGVGDATSCAKGEG